MANVPSPIKGSNFIIMFTHSEINGREQPVMAICGKRARSSYFVPMDNAYLYADSISGEPTDALMKLVVNACEALDLGNDKYIIYELMSAIVDALPELLSMPPASTETHKEMMAKVEASGLKVMIDGESIIDAS